MPNGNTFPDFIQSAQPVEAQAVMEMAYACLGPIETAITDQWDRKLAALEAEFYQTVGLPETPGDWSEDEAEAARQQTVFDAWIALDNGIVAMYDAMLMQVWWAGFRLGANLGRWQAAGGVIMDEAKPRKRGKKGKK